MLCSNRKPELDKALSRGKKQSLCTSQVGILVLQQQGKMANLTTTEAVNSGNR
jgi:hypothetical protein